MNEIMRLIQIWIKQFFVILTLFVVHNLLLLLLQRTTNTINPQLHFVHVWDEMASYPFGGMKTQLLFLGALYVY